ncbi:hypothetical protein F5Y02DRAFT_106133 [Annulohypoxylon stygium]|nr:hypothetical protein F5Y02DRAFT_106133 [Annulohypoxylon stygium]
MAIINVYLFTHVVCLAFPHTQIHKGVGVLANLGYSYLHIFITHSYLLYLGIFFVRRIKRPALCSSDSLASHPQSLLLFSTLQYRFVV